MQNQMNKRLRLGLIVAVLAVVAVLAAFEALRVIQAHSSYFARHVSPPGVIPGDLQFFYAANTVLTTINIALLVILIVIYADIYLKTRSAFTLGLVIFALVFLVKDLTSSPFIIGLYGFRAYGLGPFAFLPSLFEFVGLSILLYLSVKY